MDTQKGERAHYWWKLSHDCPRCKEDLALHHLYYSVEGQFKVIYICVKCAKTFYWLHNAFELAHRAQDNDDYNSFMVTPAVAEATPETS